MSEIGPVVRGHLQPRHLSEQRGEVVRAGDEGRIGMVQQCNVLAGAAEQISALDPLQRHVALIQLSGQLFVGRVECPLDTRPAQEKLPDPFDVEGLIGGDRRFGRLLVVRPEAIGDLDRTRLVLVGSGLYLAHALVPEFMQMHLCQL